MTGHVVLAWTAGDPRADMAAAGIEAALDAGGLAVAKRDSGLIVAARGDAVRAVAPDIDIVGELFSGAGPARDWPRLATHDRTGFEALCRQLLTRCWGSYVVLWRAVETGAPLTVFTDPVGARTCFTWHHAGVRILTSDPDRWLARFPPDNLGLDLEELAHLVGHPADAAEIRPLTGITPLEPGALSVLYPSEVRAHRLWKPRDFCSAHAGAGDSTALAQLVDDCIAAHAAAGGPAILELSGGFDSAVVAAGLAKADSGPIGAFTFFSDALAGDERRFSRAIAAQLGLDNREIALAAQPLTEDGSAGMLGIRPGIGSTTFFHDGALAAQGAALGARMLFTGRGGDALFFQHPTPAVGSDRWQPGEKKDKARVEALARWCQASVWTTARHIWTPWFVRGRDDWRPSPFAAQSSPGRSSRWAGPLEGIGRAKAMQVRAIASDRAAFGPSRCAETMRVVHPLLSQPLIEYALGQSVMVLTGGRRDRALARDAFAARLPQSIVERRGKGALGGFFGRVLAMSTDLLRGELLEGALAGAGLLDRAALERVLDPEHLMREDCYTDLLSLLVIERWMRGWRDRLRQRPA